VTSVRLAIAGSVCFAIVLSLLQLGDQGNALSRFEGQLLDIRFALRGELPPPDDIAILAIDDLSLDQAQAFPLPRDVIGMAISSAYQSGARAVVLDLLLSGETENDDALEQALAEHDRTAIALSLMDGSPAPQQDMRAQIERSSFAIVKNRLPAGPSGVLSPQQEFAENAQLGHVNVRLDDDGALRRIPVALRLGDGPAVPSLAVIASEMQVNSEMVLVSGQTAQLADREIPLTRENMAIMNYYGPSGTIETHSITRANQVDFSDKVVFIGATADGYRDAFKTPFDTSLPGVEALATLAANVLAQNALHRDQTTWVLGAVLAIGAAGFCSFATSLTRLRQVALGGAGVWIMALGALQASFIGNLWLDGATVIAALLIATVLGFSARWETHRRRAANLSQYQSPQLVETLANDSAPEFDGRMQDAAILFIDLADFTRRSAAIGPSETGKLLNRFHTMINAAAQHWSGVVSYTAGDGAMIVFGLPKAETDDGLRAVRCAIAILEKVEIDPVFGATDHPTPVRIGGHCGEVYGVVLGDEGRFTPTVTGDVVNTASRLQEQAKKLGSVMVFSDALFKTAGQPELPKIRRADAVTLRGRSTSLAIWAIDP
jgi:adenylate cyclase